ncbi:MAG TPA: thioredoxin family protein [Tepidisphaeraceae bacterium]|jgi:thiol-disulfide isomerase/thioredoxin|nr:thioredoxin family protein [Tepidisphaeraceae bacterium]
MTSSYLSEKFSQAFPYVGYLATGTAEQQRRWSQVYDAAKLTTAQLQLLSGFSRQMKVLILSGIWCGDCVQQCPLLGRIAEQRPDLIELRLLDRDANRDLTEQLRINAGDRVPVVLFVAEDFELCSIQGDRTLTRYRALARSQLGAACPIGIAPPPADELAATLQDWLNEFERIQLMLRLSARLRKKHGD